MNDKQLYECVEDKTKSVDPSRRRFTKSGLAVSGVILTLASRPVLANFGVCKSPSGFLSGNVSAHGNPLLCYGHPPEWWGSNPGAWSGAYQPGTYNNSGETSKSANEAGKWIGGTPFQTAFPGAISFEGYSMMQSLWLNAGEANQLVGAHCVAALLNAAASLTPALTETQIIDMFLEFEISGTYEPTAGFVWGEDEVITYIESTYS